MNVGHAAPALRSWPNAGHGGPALQGTSGEAPAATRAVKRCMPAHGGTCGRPARRPGACATGSDRPTRASAATLIPFHVLTFSRFHANLRQPPPIAASFVPFVPIVVHTRRTEAADAPPECPQLFTRYSLLAIPLLAIRYSPFAIPASARLRVATLPWQPSNIANPHPLPPGRRSAGRYWVGWASRPPPLAWCANPFSHPPRRESDAWCENPFSHPQRRESFPQPVARPESRRSAVRERILARASLRGAASDRPARRRLLRAKLELCPTCGVESLASRKTGALPYGAASGPGRSARNHRRHAGKLGSGATLPRWTATPRRSRFARTV